MVVNQDTNYNEVLMNVDIYNFSSLTNKLGLDSSTFFSVYSGTILLTLNSSPYSDLKLAKRSFVCSLTALSVTFSSNAPVKVSAMAFHVFPLSPVPLVWSNGLSFTTCLHKVISFASIQCKLSAGGAFGTGFLDEDEWDGWEVGVLILTSSHSPFNFYEEIAIKLCHPSNIA